MPAQWIEQCTVQRVSLLSADMKNCPLADMKVPVRGQ